MDIERERGITKFRADRAPQLPRYSNGARITCQLIDTPGHVDFMPTGSRSLRRLRGFPCSWSIDFAGRRLQTLANVYQAIDNNHEIVVVLNKIDLPAAEPERIMSRWRRRSAPRRLNAVEISGVADGAQHRGRAGSHRPPASTAEGGRPGEAAEGDAGRLR